MWSLVPDADNDGYLGVEELENALHQVHKYIMVFLRRHGECTLTQPRMLCVTTT